MYRVLRIATLVLGGVCGCFMWQFGANAQSPTAQDLQKVQQQQKQIILQQQQAEKERQRKLRQSKQKKRFKKKPIGELEGEQGRCIKINKINIEGAVLLTNAGKIDEVVKGRPDCMTIADMTPLLRKITNWYIEEGYITSRAYLPEQDLASGTLTLKVVEGRIEDIEIYEGGKPRSDRYGQDTAFPYLKGKRLYIRDLEQGLDQINRLAGKNAQMTLEPGKKDGSSIVKIGTAKTAGLSIVPEFNNYGQTSTGEQQAGFAVTLDDAFGLYESLSLSYQGNDQFYEDDKLSESLSVNLSIPYGYWTLSAYMGYSNYLTTIDGENQTFESSGVTRSFSADLSHVVHRDQKTKTTLNAFLDYRDSRNYIQDTLLEVSSRKLTSVGAKLSHNREFWDGILDASISNRHGTKLLDALNDSTTPSDFPKAQFFKVEADLSFYKPIEFQKQKLTWNFYASGQWSPDTLFATEQISAGGLYSVRGFRNESISGDTGAYVRNQLNWHLPVTLPKELDPFLNRVSIYGAYDFGWIKNDKDNPLEGGRVHGAAVGVDLKGSLFFANLQWETPLSSPDYITEKEDIFRVRVGMNAAF